MAFKPCGSLDPHGAPVLRAAIATGSITATEEDSIKISSGFAALNTTGVQVFGHVRSINTADGVGVNTTGAAGAAMGSFAGAYTFPSSNTTVAKSVVMCDISKFTLYSVDPDATIAGTTGSNLLGYYTDIATEKLTDETSALTTGCQYFIHGVDPLDSGNQIVSIYESLVFGHLT